MQTIGIRLKTLRGVDANERYAFVCELDVLQIFSLESGIEVFRIHPCDLRCSQQVEDPFLTSGDWFITPLSITPKVDKCPTARFSESVFSNSYSSINAEVC